jgi:hypothetical protein
MAWWRRMKHAEHVEHVEFVRLELSVIAVRCGCPRDHDHARPTSAALHEAALREPALPDPAARETSAPAESSAHALAA